MQTTVLTVIHVILTLSLIGLVLIQRGKGADIGAAFGGGSSNTMFGSQGAASFLTRATAVVATLFFVLSLSLAYLTSQRIGGSESVTALDESGTPAAIEIEHEMDETTLEEPVAPNDVPVVVDLPEVPVENPVEK